ncbi:major facilitator superfamily domain-containing protein [Aspergillus navahoensis]
MLVLFIASWNTLILNITNAGVLIAMGCSLLIRSPLAEIFSRKRSYDAATVVMLLASIGTALAPSMAVFTSMRVILGLTGTYFMVAGQTVIADIFVPTVRRRAVGCLRAITIRPCISGVIVTFAHWRGSYWLQVAMAGLGSALSVFAIPDTQSEVKQLYEEKADYGTLTSDRHVIDPRFGFTTPLLSGLFYLAPVTGFIVGSLVGGRLSDHTVKRSSLGGWPCPSYWLFLIGAGLMGAWNGLDTYSAGVCSKYILQYVFGATAT